MLTGLGLTNLTERANLGRAENNVACICWKYKLGRVKNGGLTGRRFIFVSGYGDSRDGPPSPFGRQGHRYFQATLTARFGTVPVGWVVGGNLFFQAAASFDKRIDTFQVGDVGRDIVTIKVSVVLKCSSRCKQCCEH